MLKHGGAPVLFVCLGCGRDAPPAPGASKSAPAATAPGPAATAPAFVGKWKLEGVTTKDGPVPEDKLDGGLTWELRADGGMAIHVWSSGNDATSPGTWELEGNVIAIYEGPQVNRVTWERTGDQLVIAATQSSVRMTFKLAP